jgi:hypothetical protein
LSLFPRFSCTLLDYYIFYYIIIQYFRFYSGALSY